MSIVAPLSKESSNNIINYLKRNFNPKSYNRGTFDEGNANIYYQSEKLDENPKEQLFEQEYINKQQIKEYEEKLADDIKKHLNNEMSSGSMINFGKAPAILQHFGVPNKSMLMSQNKYDCSTNRKTIKGSIHNISDDVMKKLPELLANPLVIAEPTDNSIYDGNNRYVVTIDALDNDNKPINVIVDYDWTGNKINIIPSVYGREEFDVYLKNCIKQNKIIYTNKKVLTSRTRVQFPRGSKNSNNIITDKEDIINSIVKKNLQKKPNNVFYQSAYHGSPEFFDEFSTNHIGSGEGAQAHGWGLYFAGDKKVSDRYVDRLGYPRYFYKGKELKNTNSPEYNALSLVYRMKSFGNDTLDVAVKDVIEFEEKQKQQDDTLGSKIFHSKVINFLKKIDTSKMDLKYGQLYEVDIPEDDVMLDEDLPFSEQPKKVQEAIKQICEDYVDNNKLVDLNVIAYTNNTSEKYKDNLAYKEGKNIYKIISDAFGGDKQASLLLNKYGIKGIKYNGHQDGECYVVFDDKAVQILNTFYQSSDNDYNINRLLNDNQEVINSELFKVLPDDLRTAVEYIFNGAPVCDVKGDEFPNNGEDLNERIYQYYKNQFNNVITNSIGNIKLDKRSIKDSIYHGINTDKVNAFVAVPYVLQKGKMLDVSKAKENEHRYLFVAPLTLKGKDYYCEVVVKSNKDRQGFYIHEIELKEKLADVFSTAHHGTSTSSKSIITNLIRNFNPNVQYQSNYSSPLENLHKRVEEKRARCIESL